MTTVENSPTPSWDNRTLILNVAYRPHDIINWKDAVTDMFAGKIEVIHQYDEFLAHLDAQTLQTFPNLRKSLRQILGVEAEGLDIKVPAVAVLRRRVAKTKSGVKFSKINVAQRDNFRCQYCGTKLPLSKLTYEHVHPRDLGGKTVWENIVMACTGCNSKKANKPLEECGLTLLSKPVRPAFLPMAEPVIPLDNAPPEWHPYLKGVNAA